MKSLCVLFTTISLLIFSGCAAVTITAQGDSDFTYRPHYQESKDFFLWGLVGEHTVNTRAACKDKTVVQMQTKFMPMDVLFGVASLGIYLPRTAMVWCERPESEG